MKPYIRSFQIFMKQVSHDMMLYAICVAPLLAAVAFRFGIPYLESVLCLLLKKQSILSEYYLLFDLLLAILTPYLFTFISAMVMLTELDENMAEYLAVTPIQKKGYIISRLFFPAALALGVSTVLMSFFTLTPWTFGNIVLVSIVSCILSIPVAMLIVSFSNNRVEGMALAKISGLILVGLPVPFFLSGGFRYLFAWLPSFWAAKGFIDMTRWPFIPSVAVSLLWIWALYRRFEKKLV